MSTRVYIDYMETRLSDSFYLQYPPDGLLEEIGARISKHKAVIAVTIRLENGTSDIYMGGEYHHSLDANLEVPQSDQIPF